MKKTNNKLVITVAVVAIVVGALAGYGIAYHKYNPNKIPVENTPGYITAAAARDQVNNFYSQYLHPKGDSPEQSRQIYIADYGTKNLEFYDEYYLHGFDPITCSTEIPLSVIAKTVKPGSGAAVTAAATYPDGSTADIQLTLVLNNEKFGIDTITCPGDKGNLPPER